MLDTICHRIITLKILIKFGLDIGDLTEDSIDVRRAPTVIQFTVNNFILIYFNLIKKLKLIHS